MKLPDLTPLFYLAGFGLLCAGILIIGGGGWLGYHIVRAILFYVGAA